MDIILNELAKAKEDHLNAIAEIENNATPS